MAKDAASGLKNILPAYVRGRQEDLGYLQLALVRKDFTQIEKISKRVAATAPDLGLTNLAEVAKELNFHAAEKSAPECEALVGKLRDLVAAL